MWVTERFGGLKKTSRCRLSAAYVFCAFAMAQPLKCFVFLATDGSLCVQGTQADAHGFSASICEI
jgi:hypothetical protein